MGITSLAKMAPGRQGSEDAELQKVSDVGGVAILHGLDHVPKQFPETCILPPRAKSAAPPRNQVHPRCRVTLHVHRLDVIVPWMVGGPSAGWLIVPVN